MPSKVSCYLRTLRRKWDLTQEELALLVPRCRRSRVSEVERALATPNARELLAYALVFGTTPEAIFRQYADEIEEEVMRGAAELDRRLAEDGSPSAVKKIAFLNELGNRQRLQADHDAHS